MALIEWNKKLSVKIDSIDKQHMVLVDMINEFQEKIKREERKEVIHELIDKMAKYAVSHFKTEEDYFQQYDYPDYVAHKAEHDAFIKKVVDLQERFKKGEFIMTLELGYFLKDWLINHIQGTDKKYVKFLKKNGVV